MTTIELVVAATLAASTTALLLGGLRSMERAARLAQARSRVVSTLHAARSHAYRSATNARVVARRGERSLVLQRDGLPDQPRRLPATTVLAEVPQRAAIRFYASGLADNATIVVRQDDRAGAGVRVVVNQRGVIR